MSDVAIVQRCTACDGALWLEPPPGRDRPRMYKDTMPAHRAYWLVTPKGHTAACPLRKEHGQQES